jgi:crotonobetainyl-CoA:carnitine CoA-transferase CaiB-like acyl-CoA transferase
VELSAPLEGMRVVDLSPDRVGAQVSQTLADYGADVVWVERPGGSRLRQEPAFAMLGRGKRSVVADLGAPEGVARVRALAAGADVLVETFRPGVADRLGVGYDALAQLNRGLVYTSITGFGSHGPLATLKGYEGTVAAVLGLFSTFRAMTGGARPAFVTVPWCSQAASHTALQGILGALLERERTGDGQRVETNLLQSVTVHEGGSSSWYGYLVAHRWPDAFVEAPPLAHHFLFRLLVAQTKDGHWLQFAQNRPHLFEAHLRSLGLEWMLEDPKWQGIPMLEDEALRAELLEQMVSRVHDRTLAEWEEIFDADRNVYAEVYRPVSEVLDHPQLVHDEAVVELLDPVGGAVRQPGLQFGMSRTPGRLRGGAPRLDDGATISWPAARGGSDAGEPSRRPVLEGLTLLELAVQYAAPYATTLLADLGARVIKIEQLEGDSIRRQRPQFPEVGGGKPLQGKESVAVDIHTPEGKEILHKLVSRADGVLNGYRAGVAERGGFDYETLRRINPDIVYINATGYGLEGPCVDRASFAPSFSAAGGVVAAHLGGLDDFKDPEMEFDDRVARGILLRAAGSSSYATTDAIGALGAATALLIGLLARVRGAGGQQVVSTMLLSTVHAMADQILAQTAGSAEGLAPGPEMRGPKALYRIYDASDGWVFLAAPGPEEWDALVDALSPYVDLRDDPRFTTAADREANDDALVDVLTELFMKRSKSEWQVDLTTNDVACVAVTTDPPEALLMSEEIGRASRYIVDVTHPLFDVHPRLAPVVEFSRSPTTPKGADLCGNATNSVLRELGYSDDDILALRAKNVVG